MVDTVLVPACTGQGSTGQCTVDTMESNKRIYVYMRQRNIRDHRPVTLDLTPKQQRRVIKKRRQRAYQKELAVE